MPNRPTALEERAPLLSVRGLRKEFATKGMKVRSARASIRAVDGISFDLAKGETLGLVGESGCGKTTTGRLVLRLLDPTEGRIVFDGRDMAELNNRELQALRRDMQIVFQDPLGALNPQMGVGELITEPLVIHNVGGSASREARLRELLSLVGLGVHHAGRFPHELSGGQRQRVCIARALALNPRFIVCDEAVSALDVSIQAQILNLLQDLKTQLDLTYLFISHDLAVIRHLADRVAVMYLGQIVELAPKTGLFDLPYHPYTKALLSAVPGVRTGKRRFRALKGDVPSPANPPSGCRFHTRCPNAQEACRTSEPHLREIAAGRHVACHFAEEQQDTPAEQAASGTGVG